MNFQLSTNTRRSIGRNSTALLTVFVCVALVFMPVVRAQRLPAASATRTNAPSPVSLATSIAALPLSQAERVHLQQAIDAHDYSAAESLLINAAERNRQSPELLTTAGRIFFLDGKYLNTAIAMKKAEALAALSPADRFTLAMAYVTLGHSDWARPELRRLAEENPQEALYPYWLARLDYDDMRFNSALEHAREAIRRQPAFTRAYEELGLCHEALGDYASAIADYKRALASDTSGLANDASGLANPDPASAWPALDLGTLLVKVGRLDEAKTYLRQALRFDPRFPKAHYQLGLLLEKRHDDTAAIRELLQATAGDPSYAAPYYVLGRIYRRQGQPMKANQAWAKFEQLNRQHSMQ